MMNKQVRNTDKKIAILLIAAFAWLFIGSLILFHQEHVLGKHIKLNSQLFISPKSSKDKQSLTVKLQQPLQNHHDHGGFSGILSKDCSTDDPKSYFEAMLRESSSCYYEDATLIYSSLRAPPAA